MPLGERDRSFEKALERCLREGCPDAETLAAYHERMLSPEEMTTWKTHVAGCERCQEILAQLELTEQVRAEAEQDDEMLVMAPARKREAGELPRRVIGWKWAVPAGAIAAGLLMWVAVHEFHAAPEKTGAVQIAQREPKAEAPAYPENSRAAKIAPATSTDQKEPAARPAAPEQAYEMAERRHRGQLTDALKKPSSTLAEEGRWDQRNSETMSRVRSATAPAPAHEYRPKTESAAPNDTHAEPLFKTQQDEKDKDQLQEPPVSERQVTDLQQLNVPSSPPVMAAAPVAANRQGAVGGVLSDRNEEAKKEKSAGDAARAVELSEAAKEDSGGKRAFHFGKSGTTSVVAAPGGKSQWILGRNGVILRAVPGRKRPIHQNSGVLSHLYAGSAPSEQVCWVVGADGTVLLTLDSGGHWKKVSSPTGADLGGVFAVDAQHALIWDAQNRQSYETDDGGATWKLAANK